MFMSRIIFANLIVNDYNIYELKFQNLGENQAEAHFKWDKVSGNYLPLQDVTQEVMPWEG